MLRVYNNTIDLASLSRAAINKIVYIVILYRRYTSEIRHRQAGHDFVVQPDAVVDPQTSQTYEVFEQQSQTVGRKDVAVSNP